MKREWVMPVIEYWIGDADHDYREASRRGELWFGSNAAVDGEIRERFGDLPSRLALDSPADCSGDPRRALAAIIVLDQFPRNLYRGSARAFEFDSCALGISLALQEQGGIARLGWMSRVFALMPMQHSEDLAVQERSVAQFEQLADQSPEEFREILRGNAVYARIHRDIVARFGRFPHRNRVLGRASTAGEIDFLEQGGPTFGQG